MGIAGNLNQALGSDINAGANAGGQSQLDVRRLLTGKDGQLFVEPYEYFDRDAMFTCSAETLFKIAEGKTDPILAVTLGRLKVEGNIDKALKLKDLINSKKKTKKTK